MNRRDFVSQLCALGALAIIPQITFGAFDEKIKRSSFSKKLVPVGRVLESEGYFVWCNSPIQAPDGKFTYFIPAGLQKKEWADGLTAVKLHML